MSVVPILEFPHSLLRRRANMVLKADKVIERLAEDLTDTLLDSAGVGLAANQIGSLKRMIALRMPEDDEPTVYINPKIIHKEGTREVQEGCLSFPDYYGTVHRSMWVKVTSLDRNSKVMRLRADGLLAQAFEHEIDHLNGILFIDHLLSHEHLFKYESEDDRDTVAAGSSDTSPDNEQE